LLTTKEFKVIEKNRKFSQKEVPRKMAKKVPGDAAKIMSQSIMKEEDGLIAEYYSVDWTSPPIDDIYPNEERSLEKVNLSYTHYMLGKSPKIKPLI
jgi:hypothetical protein